MAFDQVDSFISDDEEELCPLCVEEMDISDKNFKPCPCGYQVCQFCYNNIRQNPQLNGLCPACRRPYDDESVEYRIISQEEWKMVHEKQARKERERKQRQREKKESEQSSRKHLSGMRVIQKNLVYVIGLNPNIPTEELHHTLRTDQFFGQYGKIQKIVINRRTNANGNPGIGVYVTFARKEDAAKCIAAVDGSLNDGKYLRAAYGTTKYCSSYLRGQTCPNPNCMFLHEPGEEADSYTRQDLSTFQVSGSSRDDDTISNASSTRSHKSSPPHHSASISKQHHHSNQHNSSSHDDSHSPSSPGDHSFHLPATVSWATKASPSPAQAKLHSSSTASSAYPPLPSAASHSTTDNHHDNTANASNNHNNTSNSHISSRPSSATSNSNHSTTSTKSDKPVVDESKYVPSPKPRSPDVAIELMNDFIISLANSDVLKSYEFTNTSAKSQKNAKPLPLFSYSQSTTNNNKTDSKKQSENKPDLKNLFNTDFASYLFKPCPASFAFRAKLEFFDNQIPDAMAQEQMLQQQYRLQQEQQQTLQAQQQRIQAYQLQMELNSSSTSTPPPPGLGPTNAQHVLPPQMQQQQSVNGGNALNFSGQNINSIFMAAAAANSSGILSNGSSVPSQSTTNNNSVNSSPVVNNAATNSQHSEELLARLYPKRDVKGMA